MPEHLPSCLTKRDWHRADGYTVLARGNKVSITAIEVELNRKAADDYALVSCQFSPDDVTRVLWLVPDLKVAKWLLAFFQDLRKETAFVNEFLLEEAREARESD